MSLYCPLVILFFLSVCHLSGDGLRVLYSQLMTFLPHKVILDQAFEFASPNDAWCLCVALCKKTNYILVWVCFFLLFFFFYITMNKTKLLKILFGVLIRSYKYPVVVHRSMSEVNVILEYKSNYTLYIFKVPRLCSVCVADLHNSIW